MTPSLGGIGLFRGKMVNLCGRLTQISMNVNGTLTEEDFEIIKFIEDNAPFTMLLGNPWIERDQARKKEDEKVLERKRQELKGLHD
jgi:DNA transposition AAA+ family ATPase